MEKRNSATLIKISTTQWISIGIKEGWINKDENSYVKTAFNIYTPSKNNPESSSHSNNEITPSYSRTQDESLSKSNGYSIFSGIGVSDIGLAYLLLKKDNPRLGDVELRKMADSLVGDKKAFLEKAMASGLITKEQMESYISTGSFGPGSRTIASRIGNFYGRYGKLLGFAGGAAGGYYGTGYAIDNLKNQIRGSNEFSKEKIKSMPGGIVGFMASNLKLMQIAKQVLGISKTLDANIGQCLESIQEIQDKIKT